MFYLLFNYSTYFVSNMNSSSNNSCEQNEHTDYDNNNNNNNNIQQTDSFKHELYKQYELTEDDILHFKETFDLFDTDGKGKIDIEQVKQIISNYLTNNNNNNHNKTFSNIIKNIPHNNSNSNGVSFNDFITLISEQIAKAISKDEIFTLYTLLFSEEYNVDFFRQRIKELNMNITEQEINEMIMLGDTSGNGKVSFDDFYNIIIKENE